QVAGVAALSESRLPRFYLPLPRRRAIMLGWASPVGRADLAACAARFFRVQRECRLAGRPLEWCNRKCWGVMDRTLHRGVAAVKPRRGRGCCPFGEGMKEAGPALPQAQP